MAKSNRTIAPREFKHSPPTLSTNPISPLNLNQIIHAVNVFRSFVGADGARDRWHLHPLYETAVIAIDKEINHG